MATPSVPTFQALSSPAAVPALPRELVSRRPLSCPSVRTKERRDSKQVQERQNLLVEMLPLVKRLAFQIREHLPSHVEVDDLIANGVLGLVDAIRKFDATKRVKFESYAQHRIRGAILDGLRGADPASRDLRRKNKRVQQLYRELEVKLGRPVQDEDMAGALGMNLAQWHRALNEIESVGFDCSTRSLTTGSTSRQPCVEPALLADDPTTAGPSPFDLCYRGEQREILGRALSCLRQREQQVIVLYYRHELTMKQIADRLEVDESRVSQLHSTALARLRTSVDSLLEPRHTTSTLGLRLTFQERELGPRLRLPE